MAAAVVSDEQKDELLTQLLSMTEDRVDAQTAQSLLEVMNWDVQAAVEQLFGGPATPGASRPQSAVPPPMQRPDADMDGQPDFLDPVAIDMDDAPPVGHHGLAPPPHHPGAGSDAQLAAAIEASFRAQTVEGREASEEEQLAQVLRMSQQEEEARQRQELRQQQEQELAESVLMDQMREQEAQREREAAEVLERSKWEEEQRAKEDLEAKAARLPEEPAADDPGRVALMLKLPDGGRLQRRFRATETLGFLYDYVDVQKAELAGRYRLVSTMPRKGYEDRDVTLAQAGIGNQFVLLVELTSGL